MATGADESAQGKGPFKPADQLELTEAVRGRGSSSGLMSKLAQMLLLMLLLLFLAFFSPSPDCFCNPASAK